MIDPAACREFLSHRRLAVVGASDDAKNFGGSIFKELVKRGYEAVPVNPNVETVEGRAAYPDLASVPGELDGVIVMVSRDRSAVVVRAAIDRGVRRVWLFQGLGGAGSVSDEAVALCRASGVSVIPGACPFMFLEPVGWFHRVHRAARRMKHAVGPDAGEPVPTA
jgi:predicted CoA-binding protein